MPNARSWEGGREARQCGRSCVMRQDYLGRRRWWHERRVGRRERVRRRRHRPRRSVRRSLHGRYEYLAYISSTMPKFKGYSMDLHRVTYVDDGLAFADSARQSKWMARRCSRARCSFSKSTVTGAYRVSGSSSKRRKRLTNSPPRRPPGSLRVADASCASDRGAAAKVSPCVRDFRRGC